MLYTAEGAWSSLGSTLWLACPPVLCPAQTPRPPLCLAVTFTRSCECSQKRTWALGLGSDATEDDSLTRGPTMTSRRLAPAQALPSPRWCPMLWARVTEPGTPHLHTSGGSSRHLPSRSGEPHPCAPALSGHQPGMAFSSDLRGPGGMDGAEPLHQAILSVLTPPLGSLQSAPSRPTTHTRATQPLPGPWGPQGTGMFPHPTEFREGAGGLSQRPAPSTCVPDPGPCSLLTRTHGMRVPRWHRPWGRTPWGVLAQVQSTVPSRQECRDPSPQRAELPVLKACGWGQRTGPF